MMYGSTKRLQLCDNFYSIHSLPGIITKTTCLTRIDASCRVRISIERLDVTSYVILNESERPVKDKN